jgi:cytochrome c oxidase subunit I
MATYLAPAPQIATHRVEREPHGWTSWVTTTDHKRIGILYLVTCFVFFMVGGVEALLMRSQLAVPNNTLINAEHYNQLVTMHGTTMIFLFVVPVWAGFANYMVPLMIGARDMAFPRLNALSYWLFVAGGVVFYSSVFWNPPDAGWFSYTPLSNGTYSPTAGQDTWIYLIHLTGLASTIGAINIVVTIATMRAPGMGWGRLPLFCWGVLTQAIMLIVAIPVIAAAVTMLLTDRHFHTCYFDPRCGGSPLLWQHLFWFFGHPEVYIMILPGFGVISEVLPVFARKPIFGYKAIAASTVGIAFLSVLVWTHHMFTAPIPLVVLAFFMISSMAIAVPTGVKVINWVATLWQGSILFRTPLYFACGFLVLFTLGGLSGVMLAIFPIDWQVHGSYFVVAHFHFVLVAGAVSAVMSALYYWFPKMTGRMLSESLGKLSFWFQFVGFLVTFGIQHSLGLSGMPRRVYTYNADTGWGTDNLISTIGAFILAAGVLLTVANVVRSLKRGVPAGPDPWKANTLEWFSNSPPPAHNFDVIPKVTSVEPMRDLRAQIAQRPRDDGARHAAGVRPAGSAAGAIQSSTAGGAEHV